MSSLLGRSQPVLCSLIKFSQMQDLTLVFVEFPNVLVNPLFQPIQAFLQGGSPFWSVYFPTQFNIIGKLCQGTLDHIIQITSEDTKQYWTDFWSLEDPTCDRLSVWKGAICHHPLGASAPPIAWTSYPDHNTSTSLGGGKLCQKPWRNPGRQCPLLIPHQLSSSLCCRRWSGLSSTTCPWWMKTRNKDSDGNWYCMGSIFLCHGLGLIFPNSAFPVKHSKLCSDCSLSSLPLLPPVVGWKGELGAQKAKIMGWDMNNLLERAMRLLKMCNNSSNTNNRLHKKQTIHTQVLTPKKTQLLPLPCYLT